MEVLNLSIGILSIVLAVGAIWLSVKLYQMAEAGAEKMRESERLIKEKVDQLDRLFGLLYSDAWSLVRESYNAMQGQIYSGQGAQPARPLLAQQPAPAPRESVPISSMAAKNAELQALLVETLRTLQHGQDRVHVKDLIRAVEGKGHQSGEALEAIFDLTFVNKTLGIEGETLTPESVIFESRRS